MGLVSDVPINNDFVLLVGHGEHGNARNWILDTWLHELPSFPRFVVEPLHRADELLRVTELPSRLSKEDVGVAPQAAGRGHKSRLVQVGSLGPGVFIDRVDVSSCKRSPVRALSVDSTSE